MIITKPLLPPKAGYVEDVNEAGEHYYRPTPETLQRQAAEADTLSMAIDHEYRLTLIELGVM